MAVDPAIPSGFATLAAPWRRFEEIVAEVAAGLRVQPGDTFLDILGEDDFMVGEVSLADFLSKFARISWRLTDKTYANGGVGAVVSEYKKNKPATAKNWKAGHAEFSATGFAGYFNNRGEGGLYYLALHETSHVCVVGLASQAVCFRHHQTHPPGGDANNYANTPAWTFNEQVANAIALGVADRIAVPIMRDPRYGVPAGPPDGMAWP